MSTTLVKPAEVERKWYLLDATGKSLGHVAAEAAVLLRGKQKVNYTPNVDCGDYVVVVNCDKAVLTGKKAEQKFHITHSKFIGGLKNNESESCHYHFHLKCLRCGQLIHMDCRLMKEMQKHIETDHGFLVDSGKSVLYGLCPKCR